MGHREISDRIRQFIFQNIDSVEELDVLIFLMEQKPSSHNAEGIASNLRINPRSVSNRLLHLEHLGLVASDAADSTHFKYSPKSIDLDSMAVELCEEYRIRKHRILEIIFSPTKRARQFAAAFTITKPDKPGGEENG
jgi:hypothetical protein